LQGKLIYKCRLCGSEHTPTGVPDVSTALVCVLLDANVPKHWESLAGKISLIDLHNCKDGRVGVSDLVGGDEIRV
jgi:hypothetical protein